MRNNILLLLLMSVSSSFAVQEQIKYMGTQDFKCGHAEVVKRQSFWLSSYVAAWLSRFVSDTTRTYSPTWSCRPPLRK